MREVIDIKSFKLIKCSKVLYINKRLKYINQFEISRTDLVKNRLPNMLDIVNRIKLPTLDLGMEENLKNIENIVKNVQMHIPKVNNFAEDIIIKVNRVINDSIKIHINLINNITANIDYSELRRSIDLLEENLKIFIKYCKKHKLSMKLEYFSDYYDIYFEKNKITDEDIYVTFKSHYLIIKNNLIENDFYYPKKFYIRRLIDNFEKRRYTETAMLALATIDYLTIYNTFQEERESKYKSINKILYSKY